MTICLFHVIVLLVGMMIDGSIGGMIGVDMLADENVNRLAAMTPPSEFTLPAP